MPQIFRLAHGAFPADLLRAAEDPGIRRIAGIAKDSQPKFTRLSGQGQRERTLSRRSEQHPIPDRRRYAARIDIQVE